MVRATEIVKYFLVLANLILALVGLALVTIIGIVYIFDSDSDATNPPPSNFRVASTLLIIFGAIVFVTACLGCCGSVKESPCMLTTYAVILLVIFIIQVAFGVYVFIQINHEFSSFVRERLEKAYEGYNQNDEKKETVDAIQSFLHCCGLDNYQNMTLVDGYYLPSSCCREDVTLCRTTNYKSFYDEPCAEALEEFLHKKMHIVGGVAIGIAVAEILTAIFSLCLSSSIRNK